MRTFAYTAVALLPLLAQAALLPVERSGDHKALTFPLESSPVQVSYVDIPLGSSVMGSLVTLPGTAWFSVYNYYRITYTAGNGGFNVSVANLNGEVDLYVGDSWIPAPTYQNYNWSSTTDFTEYIYVPDSACKSGTCTFYAGVTPYESRNCSYVISANLANSPIQLIDGLPETAYVQTNDQKHFLVQWTPTTPQDVYTVNVEAVSGIPLVYGKYGSDGSGGWPGPNPQVPADEVLYGSGALIFSAASNDFSNAKCTVGTVCKLAITVFAGTTTQFVITGDSDTVPISLVAGVPVSGYVQSGKYVYYTFNTENAWTGLSIAMTAMSGDPDIFISATNPTPTRFNNTWYGVTMGNEVVQIGAFSSGWVGAPATYYIGVYGFFGNATYTLVASETTPGYTVALVDGQPQAGQTFTGHAFSYYTFNVTSDASQVTDLDFIASPVTNDVDLYISLNPAVLPKVVCNQPSIFGCQEYGVDPKTYQYSSILSQQPDFVVVPKLALQAGQQVVVGVFASSPDAPDGTPAPPSAFSVVASSGLTSIELQAGVPTQGVAGPGVYKYYSFTTTAINDLIITAGVDAGSVQIFASETQKPQANNNQWNSTSRGGIVVAPMIYIPFSSLSWHCRMSIFFSSSCTVYISVKGWENLAPGTAALYNIQADVGGSTSVPTQLANGRTTQSYAPAAGFEYFISNINMASQQSIYAIVQSWVGSADLWANLGSGKTFASPSNNMQADIHSTDLGGYARAVFMPPYAQAIGNEESQGAIPEVSVFKLPAVAPYSGPKVEIPLVDNGVKRRMLTMDTDATYLSRYYPETLEALGATPYCTNCPLYLTVGATGGRSSYFGITVTSGATYTQLQDGRTTFGLNGINETRYYTFSVNDPNSDVKFTINQFFGTVNAFVLVQSPSRPYQVPSASSWTWRILPWSGVNSVVISHNDTNFCRSADGVRTTAPCTFIVGVYGRFPRTQSAYYSIIADEMEAVQITPLDDGQPIGATVFEGDYAYYSFAAETDGVVAVAPILMQAEASVGRVEMYVTNQYQPGMDTSYLPTRGNTKLQCMWSAQNFSTLFITATDPCFNINNQVYTIGVVGATGYPISSTYQLTVTDSRDMVKTIEFGIPRINEFVRDNENSNFSFVMYDTTDDIIISATANYGSVTVLVAHHTNNSVAPPSCTQGPAGTKIVCTGWTWQGTGQYGSGSILIPAINPCAPTTGTGLPPPLVNQATCNSDWRTGRFLVTVYGTSAPGAEFSISVQSAGTAMELADGQPQLALTSPVVFCPNRDPVSGSCTGNGADWFHASAAFVTFSTADTDPAVDQFVLLERLCTNEQAGLCGQPMQMYVKSCALENCATVDSFPYWQHYDATASVLTETTGTLRFPSCQQTTNPPAPCIYTVSIFPVCSTSGSPPGVGCLPGLVRMTWSGDTGIERIPGDCFGAGMSCRLPVVDVGQQFRAVRRYEAYTPAPMSVQVQACTGDVDVYLCSWGMSTGCVPFSMPGPSNFDISASTYAQANGIAQIRVQNPDLFYLGVTKDAKSAVPNPLFVATLVSGNAQTLIIPPGGSALGISRSADWSTISVSWTAPVLYSSGQPYAIPSDVTYFAYAFPSPVDKRYNMEAACGVSLAYQEYDGLGVQLLTTGSLGVTFTVERNQNYTVAVLATCPAGTCMRNNQQTQIAVYVTAQVGPPTDQPASSPSGNGAAVAGGVIGTLLILGAAAGLVWYFRYKRPASAKVDYSRMSANADPLSGGDLHGDVSSYEKL